MDVTAPAVASTLPQADQLSPESAPVTYQQEWVWGLLVDGNELSFIPRTYAWRLRGSIDLERMCSCLAAMSKTHSILRTRIWVDMGIPRLQIDASNACRMEVVELEETKCDDTEVRRFLEVLSSRPPALTARASFEFRVIPMDDANHVLAVTMHHMFTDLTSLRLLLEEFWHCYSDLPDDHLLTPADRQMQYHDYAAWQRSTHARWLAAHEDYWRTKLSGAERFRLPVEAIRGVAPHSLAELRESLDPALSSAIVDCARRERTMAPLVFLASYAIVLRRWSGQEKLTIPFNVSGRHLPVHGAMLGPLGQMLFITIELRGSESFSDVLRVVAQEFSTAHEHLDYAKVSIRYPELLKSGFVQYLSWDPADLANLPEITRIQRSLGLQAEQFTFNATPPGTTTEYDATLQIVNTANGFLLRFWYRGDLLSAYKMKELAQDCRRVLEQFAADSSVLVASLKD